MTAADSTAPPTGGPWYDGTWSVEEMAHAYDVLTVKLRACEQQVAEAEKRAEDRIVAWLRTQSEAARHFDYDQYDMAADAIERGEHRG